MDPNYTSSIVSAQQSLRREVSTSPARSNREFMSLLTPRGSDLKISCGLCNWLTIFTANAVLKYSLGISISRPYCQGRNCMTIRARFKRDDKFFRNSKCEECTQLSRIQQLIQKMYTSIFFKRVATHQLANLTAGQKYINAKPTIQYGQIPLHILL